MVEVNASFLLLYPEYCASVEYINLCKIDYCSLRFNYVHSLQGDSPFGEIKEKACIEMD